jgi:hypothetical protein
VVLERKSTKENAGRYFASLDSVYGEGPFVQMGLAGELVFDPTVNASATGNRFRLKLYGRAFPGTLDVESFFGKAGGEISGLLASSPWPALSLALRGGAEQLWGEFPWHEAAFIGGTSNLPGWDEQRFAGDAAVFGGAELRLKLWRPRIVVPVSMGVFGFGNGGRVYLDGESPGGWHTDTGGGIYFQPVMQPNILRLGLGKGKEVTKVFLTLGLPY